MEDATSLPCSVRRRKRPRPASCWPSTSPGEASSAACKACEQKIEMPLLRQEAGTAAVALLLLTLSVARGAHAATSTGSSSSSSSSSSLSVSSTTTIHHHEPPPAPESIFSSEQLLVLVEVGDVLAALSLLGSAFIVASYVAFRHLRTFAYKLILSLALANAGFDIATLGGYGAETHSFQCQAQAVATIYFSLVQMALVTAIMGTCYAMVVRRDYGVRSRLAAVTAACWGVPLLMALLPLTTDSYGNTGAWCTIVSTNLKAVVAGTVWRFVLLYVPLWVSTAANAYLYWRVWRAAQGLRAALRAYDDVEDDSDDNSFAAAAGATITSGSAATATAATGTGSETPAVSVSSAAGGGGGPSPSPSPGTRSGTSIRGGGGGGGGSGGSSLSTARAAVGGIVSSGGGSGGVGTGSVRSGETTLQIIVRLRMYPVALILCWSWSSVNRVYEVFEPYNAQYWLTMLQYTFQFMQGVCNAIIFALTPTVLSSWHILLTNAGDRCCRCCRKPGAGSGAAAAAAATGGAAARRAPRSPPQPFWRRFVSGRGRGGGRAGNAGGEGKKEGLLPMSVASRPSKE